MATIATVRISDPSTPGGFLTINEADFDPAVHRQFAAAPVEPTPAPAVAPVQKPKPAPKPAATAPKPGAQS